MRTLKSLLLAGGSLLGMAGCLPDFSPDPINSDVDPANPDSGVSADSGSRDSSVVRDASGPVVTPDAGEPGKPDARVEVPTGPAPTECNLTGKYAITERFAMDGLGAKQIVWNWYYAEISQSGNDITYKKSLSCGANVVGAPGSPKIQMDDSQAWDAYTKHPAYEGRKGTVQKVGDGCMVSIAKDAAIRGGTVATYRDITVPLPKLAQEGKDGSPGWEDWDADGEPGVTLNISGLASGKLYAVMRNITAYSGVVPEGADLLTMTLDWSQSRETLKYTSWILTADAALDTSAKQIVEFGRMTDEQASGDDLAICQNVRDLVEMLTPNASALTLSL
jgi:hypothetical protein